MDISLIIILSLAVLLLISFLVIKLLQNKKKKKVEEQKTNVKTQILKEMHGLDKKIKNPKQSLSALNKIAREFFKQYLKEKEEDTYVELEELLRKKKNIQMIDFCEKMDNLLYSGKTITKSQALEMISQFRNLLKHLQQK